EKLRQEIAGMGNSVLVVGDPELVRVHVHTDEPTRVINLASTYGRLERLNVGDMSTQHRRIREESADRSEATYPQRNNGIGLVAVVAGTGLADIMRGLGADAIVEGGQTMNPSTQDMLAAVERVPYQDVILLPNNRNVVLAASQVNGLTSKEVRVLETVSVPEGVAALVSFHPDRSLEENLAAMRKAGERVQTIEVTHAVRDSR